MHHFTAFVIAAIGADAVGQAQFAAIGAGYGVARLQGVVRPAAVAAALGMLTLR